MANNEIISIGKKIVNNIFDTISTISCEEKCVDKGGLKKINPCICNNPKK